MYRNSIAIIVLLALIVGLGLGYYFGYDHGWEKSSNLNEAENETTGTPFLEQGILMYNNPGLKADTWFLNYEKPGQPALKAELVLNDQSQCVNVTGGMASCKELWYSVGSKVEVEGIENNQTVIVSKVREVKATDPKQPSATVPFTESQVYGFYGTLTLTGYLDVQTRVCNPGDMCGETVQYASFVFTSGANDALKKFTGQNTGNSFIAGDRLGLGCYEKDKNRIYYENDADSGYITGEIKGPDFTKLMASSKTNQVQLKFTREIYTSGRGAPDCYSHFRNFDVI
jgi:hypothetical protein